MRIGCEEVRVTAGRTGEVLGSSACLTFRSTLHMSLLQQSCSIMSICWSGPLDYSLFRAEMLKDSGYKHLLGNYGAWIQIPVLTVTSWVTSGKFLDVSMSQCSYL